MNLKCEGNKYKNDIGMDAIAVLDIDAERKKYGL